MQLGVLEAQFYLLLAICFNLIYPWVKYFEDQGGFFYKPSLLMTKLLVVLKQESCMLVLGERKSDLVNNQKRLDYNKSS